MTMTAHSAAESPIAAGAPSLSANASRSGMATASPSSNRSAPRERMVARCALGMRSLIRADRSGPTSAGTSATASMSATDGIDGNAPRIPVAASSTATPAATMVVSSTRPANLCASHEAATVVTWTASTMMPSDPSGTPTPNGIRLKKHVVDDQRHYEDRRVQHQQSADERTAGCDAYRRAEVLPVAERALTIVPVSWWLLHGEYERGRGEAPEPADGGAQRHIDRRERRTDHRRDAP